MVQRLRFADGFALLGLAVTGALLVYSFSSFHAVMNPIIVLCLCPPAILSVAFIDVHPTTAQSVVMWLLIASINSVLYGGVGALISNRWKSN